MWLALLLFVNDIDRAAVRKVVAAHRSEIEQCYASGLKANPSLAGRVVVRMSIDGKGKVTEAKIVESDLGAPDVELCLTKNITTWKFPPFGAGDPVRISYPFVFRPQ